MGHIARGNIRFLGRSPFWTNESNQKNRAVFARFHQTYCLINTSYAIRRRRVALNNPNPNNALVEGVGMK